MWKIPRKDYYIYLCFIAYTIGLFCSRLFSRHQNGFFLTTILILTIISIAILRQWQSWRVTGFVCIIFSFTIVTGFYYYYWRLPIAGNFDISHHLLEKEFSAEVITVEGKLLSNPNLNQKQKGRFIFQAQKLIDDHGKAEKVTGKVYVTAPLLQVTGLYPSMTVRLRGNLYQPRNSLNPWDFSFADYLSRDGIFVGLSAQRVDVVEEGNWWNRGISWLRQRIVQTHVRYLKVPQGNLLSSMVIGNRGVDLDWELQDNFRLTGLAHTLAASGFHVSILLGLLLYLTSSWDSSPRLLTIALSLFIYAGITGFSPSILRACLMGLAVVVGIVLDRSVNVYGSLLLAGVILLIINPLWIWDLGFQFSFLATWGLIVTVPAIVDYLDWLPPTLANLVAVPLAANIWIFPLQCYVFHYVPLYGIFTNIVTTPLIFILTIGGFISTCLGLFFPLFGSAIAYLCFPFIWLLIKIVDITINLPFTALAVGEIVLIQLFIIYLSFLLICFSKSIRKYGFLIIFSVLIAVVIPLIEQKINLRQVTILNNSFPSTVIIQNKNKNGLINLVDKENVKFQIIPFLRNQGVNKIDLILTSQEKNQPKLLNYIENIPFLADNINEIKKVDNNFIFEINYKKWLIINNKNELLNNKNLADILIWNEKAIAIDIIEQIKPQIIITNSKIDEQIIDKLNNLNIQLLSTENNTIQWNNKLGFKQYNEE
jgi:competence protein ComEC